MLLFPGWAEEMLVTINQVMQCQNPKDCNMGNEVLLKAEVETECMDATCINISIESIRK
jgi:hypothetical protein